MNRRYWILRALLALLVLSGAAFLFIRWRAAVAQAQRIADREAEYRGMGIYSPGSADFVPLPPETPHRAGAALLGAALFADKRLVKSSKRICAACHPLSGGGVDGKIHGGRLTRSTQNAAFASCYMHDGRLRDLGKAVELMVSDPAFGAYSVTGAVVRLMRDNALAARFAANYETGLVASNVVDAIVQHLHARVTPSGAFDRHLSGVPGALGEEALRGFEVFKAADCAKCHGGPALGGRVVSAGRKVPALRGLSKRRVYLSDGSASDLPTALVRMPTADIADADRAALVAFLSAL
jgi:cytochrome c peroxidase